jgi:RNA polymerase sigma-70 factor (ECF subfamily)
LKKTDAELVEAYKNTRSQDAFAQIYNIHIGYVYRFIYSRVGDTTWAEDITSEVFSTLLTVLPNFEGKSSLRTFVTGIALNKIREFWREKKRQGLPLLDEDLVVAEDDDAEDSPRPEFDLDAVLAKLPEHYRKVLEARFIEGLSAADTGELLEISPGNVRVLQHRALQKASDIANELMKNE